MSNKLGLIQPDSATATSEFSISYDIGNVIDGSGLPVNFTHLDAHSDYTVNNHWTTASGAIDTGVSATFHFNQEVNLNTFYFWNHRSNNIANDPNYAVTVFDLIFKDKNNETIFSLFNQSASGGIAKAQIYKFKSVVGVKSIDFLIDNNEGSPYTGAAEVAFNAYEIDDGSLPSIFIKNQSFVEGNNGTKQQNFTVSLSEATTQTVTVKYKTLNQTARAGDDYLNKQGTLTFQPGETKKNISIPIKGDKQPESNETFLVRLSNPTKAKIAQEEATATIKNDDGALPKLSINNVIKKEGNTGQTSFQFDVSLAKAAQGLITVDYATQNGSAKSGQDFKGIGNGTLTFQKGNKKKTITVKVKGDKKFEKTEIFSVKLSNAINATIGKGIGKGTIQNDDKKNNNNKIDPLLGNVEILAGNVDNTGLNRETVSQNYQNLLENANITTGMRSAHLAFNPLQEQFLTILSSDTDVIF